MESTSPRRVVATSGPTATLEEVDILRELDTRPARSPDYETLNRALAALAEEMAVNPRNMLQRLVEVAVDLSKPTPPASACLTQLVQRLVDDLLDIGRIEAGKLVLNEQTVDLRPIVQESVEMRRPFVVDRQHELHLDLACSPVITRADPFRVTQIVANLIDNAAKYTPPHGHIHVSVAALDGHAEITVQDNGDGIPPDRVDAIFETFTQLRPASGGPGLGLGLGLVRRLTELQGGSIRVFSDGPGKGSRFTVRLPAAFSGL